MTSAVPPPASTKPSGEWSLPEDRRSLFAAMPISGLPPVLYHYTSLQGLTGILGSKTLWATNLHYLNDTTELAHALDIVSPYLESVVLTAGHAGESELKRTMLDSLNSIRAADLYVSSFSQNGDLLSQWRGYGGGVSIGFTTTRLLDIARSNNLLLAQCLYHDAKQRILHYLTDKAFADYRAVGPPPPFFGVTDRQQVFAGIYRLNVGPLAAMMKDDSFAEEAEWRLVTAAPVASRSTSPTLQVRPGVTSLIPYIEIPLPFDSIVEIVHGPTPNPELGLRALYVLLAKHSLGVRCRNSSVPFRRDL